MARRVVSPKLVSEVNYFISGGFVGFHRKGKGQLRFIIPCPADNSLYKVRDMLREGHTFEQESEDLLNFVEDIDRCVEMVETYEKESKQPKPYNGEKTSGRSTGRPAGRRIIRRRT